MEEAIKVYAQQDKESTEQQQQQQSLEQQDRKQDNTIKDGDMAIVYEDISTLKQIVVKKDGKFLNHFGVFEFNDLIGKQFGIKLYSNNQKGYIYILKPNPLLITNSIVHRTQILYQTDISQVLMRLRVLPGSIVVESGTGSCSLSASFINGIGTKGHLYTYEFNQDRAIKAREYFQTINASNNVTCIWRDVCENGFKPLQSDQEQGNPVYTLESCDCVFLDLPKPWEALEHVVYILKQNGRVCCFSPCIEQVQRSCEKLSKLGFGDIRTFEGLSRTFDKKKQSLKQIDPETHSILGKRKHEENISTKTEFYFSTGPFESRGHTSYLTYATLYKTK